MNSFMRAMLILFLAFGLGIATTISNLLGLERYADFILISIGSICLGFVIAPPERNEKRDETIRYD